MLAVAEAPVAIRLTLPRWLLRPSILPDELAYSYALRVLILNAAETLESLIAAVAAEGAVDPKVTKLEFLARAADISVSEFVRFHSLAPFQQAFTLDATPRTHGEKRDSHLRYEALRVKVPFFRICESCMREDLEYWGFPILRVSHHVHGIDSCVKHVQPLTSTGFETSHISRIQRFSWAMIPSGKSNDFGSQNPVVQRYASIATDLMARPESIPVTHISNVIANRAQLCGLRRSIRGKRKLISDLVLESTPKAWIDQLLPGLLCQKRNSGVFSAMLDTVTKPAIVCQPEAYIIALAVLYPDPDEAMSNLTSTQKQEIPVKPREVASPAVGKPARAYTATEVAQAYVKSNFSYKALQKTMGRSSIWVRNILLRFDLPPARLIGNKATRAALLRFKSGADIQSACTATGASEVQLVNLLRFDLDQIVRMIRQP